MWGCCHWGWCRSVLAAQNLLIACHLAWAGMQTQLLLHLAGVCDRWVDLAGMSTWQSHHGLVLLLLEGSCLLLLSMGLVGDAGGCWLRHPGQAH